MKLRITLSTILLAWLITSAASAATFTVNDSFDNSFAHDLNPGDGICEVSPGTGVCTLRAALEEANATAALDTILFDDALAGAVVTLAASEGGLPLITNQVFILGESIDGYNTTATLLRNAPPQITIDGSSLPGLPAGLVFDGTGASDSLVSALSIVNFGGSGILMRAGASTIRIDRNYIGATPAGGSAGNGINGIHALATGNHQIGKVRNTGGTVFLGLGNVISSNGGSGIYLENSNSNGVRGNLIGFAPTGTSDRGNGAFGIRATGNGNAIGDRINDLLARNHIGANNSGGIQVIGNSNLIHANSLGRGETGGFIASEGDGISVFGSLNFIGNNNGNGNMVFEHAGRGIRLGLATGGAADDNFVIANQIGSAGSQFPILLSGNMIGIEVGNGDRNIIQDNIVLNSLDDGISIRGDENDLQGNQVGFVIGISGSPLAEANDVGIRLVGSDSRIENNQIAGNASTGMVVAGANNDIVFNFIGVTSDFAPLGNLVGLFVNGNNHDISMNAIGDNGGFGLFLDNVTNSLIILNNIGVATDGSDIGNLQDGISVNTNSADLLIRNNHIAFNNGNGVEAASTVLGITWFENLIHDNSSIGIDLNIDGATPNDPGDDDLGANQLQNFPVIENVILDRLTTPPTLTVSYRVDSDSDNSAYQLTVDFYWTDVDEVAQGRFYLGADFNYSSPNALGTMFFDFPDGVFGGWLTAIAQDTDGNSSEFSTRMEFGDPGEVFFRDGFEN